MIKKKKSHTPEHAKFTFKTL